MMNLGRLRKALAKLEHMPDNTPIIIAVPSANGWEDEIFLIYDVKEGRVNEFEEKWQSKPAVLIEAEQG